MKILDIGDAGMMRTEPTDLSLETVPLNEYRRKDGVNPIARVETATVFAVIHLVETAADTQD
jgi:hypothetical protein